MKKIRVLVSAAGAPGCSTLIRQLQGISERKIEVVAVDMDSYAIGRFLVHKFYQVPPASSDDYISAIEDIIIREDIGVFYTVSSAEILKVADHKTLLESSGCKVLASNPAAIRLAENKYELYKVLSEKTQVPVPKFFLPQSLEEFIERALELGYPEKQVCFKPPVSKGSRGFRILNAHIDRRDLLLNYKPEAVYMSLDEFKDIFKTGDFPQLLIMEVVQGPHYDVMALALEGEPLLITVKTREASRWGIITKGELVNNPVHVEYTKQLLRKIPLSYNVGIQYIGEKVIEINPRPSTFIYQEDMVEPYLAIKLALGELSPDEIKAYQSKIQYSRRMLRYMDQIFWNS